MSEETLEDFIVRQILGHMFGEDAQYRAGLIGRTIATEINNRINKAIGNEVTQNDT